MCMEKARRVALTGFPNAMESMATYANVTQRTILPCTILLILSYIHTVAAAVVMKFAES